MKNWAKNSTKQNKKNSLAPPDQKTNTPPKYSQLLLMTGKSLQQGSTLSSWKGARGNIQNPAEGRILQPRTAAPARQMMAGFTPACSWILSALPLSVTLRGVSDCLCFCQGYRKGSRGCSSCSDVHSHSSTEPLDVLGTWSSPAGIKERTGNAWLQGHQKEVLQVQIRQ